MQYGVAASRPATTSSSPTPTSTTSRAASCAAVHEMQEHRLSLLSLMPLFIWKSIWENAAAPAFLLAMTNFLSGPIHEPDSDDALAIGAFIMVDAEVYRVARRSRGRAQAQMLDDVMLARYFKAHGQRVAFRVAPQCLSVRMYNERPRGVLRLHQELPGRLRRELLAGHPARVHVRHRRRVGALGALRRPVHCCNPTLLALGLFVYFEVWLAVVLARSYMKTNLLKLAGFRGGRAAPARRRAGRDLSGASSTARCSGAVAPSASPSRPASALRRAARAGASLRSRTALPARIPCAAFLPGAAALCFVRGGLFSACWVAPRSLSCVDGRAAGAGACLPGECPYAPAVALRAAARCVVFMAGSTVKLSGKLQ